MTSLSRRSFLKLSLTAMLGLGFSPQRTFGEEFFHPGPLARIAADDKVIKIYEEPTYESDVVRETDFDDLLNIYFEKRISDAENHEVDTHQHVWYRVWGGYLPGAYVQKTHYQLNDPLNTIPSCGKLAEVTVPYTQALQYNEWEDHWENRFRLYYSTTHWITDLQKGPDGDEWYKLTSELSDTLYYFVKREHLRPIPDIEFIPTRIHVPPQEKRIEVNLVRQQMTAFEYDQPVKQVPISSGLGFQEVPKGTATPVGNNFGVTSKHPSKHMGSTVATGAPGGYSLPGVPWTTFFIFETGVAFHGTYWHNNFGHKMSHGCINMRNEDAKWLFRWSNPPYEPPFRDHCQWEKIRPGTQVKIYYER